MSWAVPKSVLASMDKMAQMAHCYSMEQHSVIAGTAAASQPNDPSLILISGTVHVEFSL